jgi:hypothetical protein
MRGTPGLPPLFAPAVRQEQSGEAGKKVIFCRLFI